MTQEERQVNVIAKGLVKYLVKFEQFNGDPELVCNAMEIELIGYKGGITPDFGRIGISESQMKELVSLIDSIKKEVLGLEVV